MKEPAYCKNGYIFYDMSKRSNLAILMEETDIKCEIIGVERKDSSSRSIFKHRYVLVASRKEFFEEKIYE